MAPDWAWSHVTKLTPYASSKGAGRWKCNYCGKMYGGPPKRIKAHLAKVSGHDIEACSASNVPLHIQNQAHRIAGTQSASQSQPMSASIGHEGSSVGRKRMRDGNIEEMLDDARNMNLDDAISKFIFLNAIPFNVVKSLYFHAMIAAACSAGPSAALRILGYKKLRTTQLTRHYTLIKEKLALFRDGWARFGCTIVTDGWSDIKSRSFINFMVTSIHGSIFWQGIDTKGEEKTGLWLWEQLRPIILVENVVQVIIDNASNCVSMGEHMREEFPFILHNQCVCHVLDLLLEDIGKFDWVSKIVNDCEKIVKFITEKPMLLALFRKFCSRELMKPAKTRFAYIFLMVSQLQHEDVFPCL
ncbi:uncharacterized protein LOC112350815 [Selaginella moellendorffii]|uniref:uncharacterized protein LOC112350815 n=1 Tax=Selaginella moellendorffii TaxID=88036 RepID=UPI000D1C4ADD|nr:uncharacterized protein LOC112350815 [Selaginella moellendorffii]|eukprot:XP_024543458.1 uncharacterized protein LOC112350815 [Selaginella moellendorffii]